MLSSLLLAFILIPIVELAILIKVGQAIGVLNTVLIVIFTGMAGAFLARTQGLITLMRIQQDINEGVMPTEKLIDGVMILCGGMLLLTPGLISDVIGLMALIPFTRGLIKRWIKRKIKNMITRGRIITIYPRQL